MIVGSQDRVILPVNRANRLDVIRKRRKLLRRWKEKGRTPKCMSHCVLYRRELFTAHGQCFDGPDYVDGDYIDAGEPIQRYCEERALGIRYLAPLFWHFEAATLNLVTGRTLSPKRRWRTRRFYRLPDVQQILSDVSLDA